MSTDNRGGGPSAPGAPVRQWYERAGYGFRHAEADTEEALVALRDEWFKTRPPAGYGFSGIRRTDRGTFTMSQALSCD